MINHRPWKSECRIASTKRVHAVPRSYVCKSHKLKNYKCQMQYYKATVQEPKKGWLYKQFAMIIMMNYSPRHA